MGILVTEIINRAASALDAEGSDRYVFDRDFQPAINSAMEFMVSAITPKFADKKFSPEKLRDLNRTRVFQTNGFSRVAIDLSLVNEELWTVLSVMPNPTVHPNNIGVNQSLKQDVSVLRADLTFVSADDDAKRLTQSEYNKNKGNPFKAGFKDARRGYYYVDFSNYGSTNYSNANGEEIEIHPDISVSLVGVAYIKYPKAVVLQSDTIEFPRSMTDLIVKRVLNFISIKQGDKTNLYTITERDVLQALQV